MYMVSLLLTIEIKRDLGRVYFFVDADFFVAWKRCPSQSRGTQEFVSSSEVGYVARRTGSRLRGHGASCLNHHSAAISTAGPSPLAAGLALAEEVVVGGVRNERLLTHVGGGGAAGSRSRSPVGV